jgi:phosphoserine phosphatase
MSLGSLTLSGDKSPSEELRERLAGLTRLLNVTVELAAALDLDDLLRKVTVEACTALGCERASLFRYDPQTEELYTSVVTELEISEIRARIGEGIIGHAARERRLVHVPDPAADPRWNSAIDRQTGFTTRNILAAPLSSPHDGRLLGVLQLLNKRHGTFDAFDEELLVAFSQHAAVGLDRARMVDELRRREAALRSLEVAREIQRGFMPRTLPSVPGYEAATWWFPNEAVGGDYCDVLELRDGRTGLVIADVSGHGLGPSLIMASARAALRALAAEHSSTERLLGLLGRALATDLDDGRFITMALAALDPEAHTLVYANAGHAPALHYRAASGEFQSLEATGLPLGVLERPDYPESPPCEVRPGDLLFFCTDGIVDAVNEQDQRFGQRRLEALIREHAGDSVQNLVQNVAQSVCRHFVGQHPQDDLTILAAKRLA